MYAEGAELQSCLEELQKMWEGNQQRQNNNHNEKVTNNGEKIIHTVNCYISEHPLQSRMVRVANTTVKEICGTKAVP